MATAAPELADRALPEDELQKMDRYWRAANYLSVGQIYLLANPLLREPLTIEHIKPRLLGHWGTTPGLNFIYVHMNRIIRAYDLDTIYVCGPGHGGPGMVANAYLEGTYSELYPEISDDAEGMRRLFKQFSFPGRNPESRRTRGPGVDPRGRRARIRRLPRVRRRVRQPRPARRVHRRRRRGRDRPAGGVVALEQVPQPGARRRRAADPAPERLQDREPDPLRAHRSQGAREPVRGLRVQASLRRGRRPSHHAPPDGVDARHRGRARSRRSSATRGRTGTLGGRSGP